MTKYVPYYRVSTDKQGRSGLGLEAQEEMVRQFIGQGDRLLLPPYVEMESGRKTSRPELDKALKACRAHRATLIIAKLDRLARNQQFLMKLVDDGVNVVFCDFPEITAGAVGRFMLQQMAAVAELEAGLISERTRAALRAKVARDGQWDRKAKHHLVPGAGQKAATAAVQRQALRDAEDKAEEIAKIKAEGITTASGIAAELNRRDVTTPRGGRWQAVQVQRVMQRIGV